jgi:hypothetical protein
MANEKILVVDCSFCNDRIEITVPADLAQNRDYYPFEYLNIHGNPEHAIMLFIDKNLTVRDTIVYEDLNFIKSKVEKAKKKQVCHVCLMEIADGIDTAISCPNGHLLHDDCFEEWIDYSKNCPKCQKAYPKEVLER